MKRLLLSGIVGLTTLAGYAGTPAGFPGGDEALASYLKERMVYPTFARQNGIEGTVRVIFTVDRQGNAAHIRIARPLDPELEAEAIRLVKAMPAWIPATDDAGNPVDSETTLPVSFLLPE